MKRASIGILVPILVGLGYCAFEELRPPDTRPFARRVFGMTVDLGKPDVQVETPRSWQGDGFSFERFLVSREILEQFTDSSNRMAAFPIFPEFRKLWRCQTWRRTPAAAADSTALRTALSEAPPNAAADAKRTLNDSGNWYSLCVKSAHENSFHMNVDLYLLDIKRATFVFANFQM